MTAVATNTRATTRLVYLPLAQLLECPDNPRKQFDAVGMEQLRDSLAKNGMITPIRARELGAGPHMIAAGHRRFRAAGLAKLDMVPVLLGPMTDEEFYDVLLIENQDRRDLHPLEEARGFELAMKKLGWDVDRIAAEVGRPPAHVRDRLRLQRLTPEAKRFFTDGAFTLGHANVLATLSEEDQDRALDPNTAAHDGGLFQLERVGEGVQATLELKGEKLHPRAVAEFKSWVQRHVRFNPEEQVDLEHLLPETATLLQAAEVNHTKIIPITRDYLPHQDAKDGAVRTYGERAWKRADGLAGSKVCEHAVVAFVSSGPGRGEALRVCVAKDKCPLHWRSEAATAKRRKKERAAAAASGTAVPPKRSETPAERRAREKAARRDALDDALGDARIQKQVLDRVYAVLRTAPTGPESAVALLVLEQCKSYDDRRNKTKMKIGNSAEDVLRAAAFLAVKQSMDDYNGLEDAAMVLRKFDIDLVAFMEEIVPKSPAAAGKRDAFDGDEGATHSADELDEGDE